MTVAVTVTDDPRTSFSTLHLARGFNKNTSSVQLRGVFRCTGREHWVNTGGEHRVTVTVTVTVYLF